MKPQVFDHLVFIHTGTRFCVYNDDLGTFGGVINVGHLSDNGTDPNGTKIRPFVMLFLPRRGCRIQPRVSTLGNIQKSGSP